MAIAVPVAEWPVVGAPRARQAQHHQSPSQDEFTYAQAGGVLVRGE